MKPWEGVALVCMFTLVLFMSVILGLVHQNVLLDPNTCCEKNTACFEVLSAQKNAFYNPLTGLRSRFIVSLVFFMFTAVLRCTSFVEKLDIYIPQSVIILLALISYTALLLFGDTSFRIFATVQSNLLPVCSASSTIITNAVDILSWMIFIISFVVFFMFMLSTIPQDSVYPDPFVFIDSPDSDEDEDVVQASKYGVRYIPSETVSTI